MRLAEQFPVVAITGPRQSGKSTLTKYAFPDGVIIDEAQKVPEIFDAIKLIIDKSAYTPGKFIQVCALYSGQMVNYDSISRDIGVSAVTIKNWCSILEASYIIHFLEPDSNDLGRTVVKTPKLYFVDSGLMCYLLRLESKEELLLDDHKGAVVETATVSELLKKRYNDAKKANLTYYRDKNGFEVDIITDWKKNFAIEVKSKSDVEKKLSTSVRTYVGLRTDSVQGSVFYLGDVSCEINGIRYVSWSEWGS